MATLLDFALQAQLAQAAYGNFNSGAQGIDVMRAELIRAEMVERQALAFASEFLVVDRYSNPTGLSATVFEDRGGRLEALERSMSELLAERAPKYRSLAVDAGRPVVAQFVTNWLLQEHQWGIGPDYRVTVLFPGEQAPAARDSARAGH
jgi:hypothetical protein